MLEVVLFTTKGDIEELQVLMTGIAKGEISRNKNFYSLTRLREFNRFKRAKLFISLVEDIKKAKEYQGSKVEVTELQGNYFLQLYNPLLKYNRKMPLSKEELSLISRETKISTLKV